ncbi:UNVERIFIED_CONTAM: NME NM23 member 5 [Siphonaria sp. JEL0065]|nr:NME NM23 member 5 [Siphonaria sp. JEL0065]
MSDIPATQHTVLLIRPEAQHCENHVVHSVLVGGFKVLDVSVVVLSWPGLTASASKRKHIQVSPEQAAAFFPLTDYRKENDNDEDSFSIGLSSRAGSSVVLLLARFNAFDEVKTLIGPRDLKNAKDFAPISLRAKYAVSEQKCALEATLTPEHTEVALRIFFPDRLRTTLPNAEESKILLEESLYPVLTKGLTMLCKEKPANPTVWLGNWLVEHNPNRPNVSNFESN